MAFVGVSGLAEVLCTDANRAYDGCADGERVEGGETMPVVIPDEVLKEAGLSEREVLIEVACRLYDTDRLDLWPAAKLCGLDRLAFINELQRRRIPVFRPSVDDVEHDVETLAKLGRES